MNTSITEKEVFILNSIDIFNEKKDILDTTFRISNFLKNKEGDAIIKKILGAHSHLFLLLLARLVSAYQYWHIKKKLKVGNDNDNIYFKFSNSLMYDDKFLSKEIEKEQTKNIIKFFIGRDYINKRYFEIHDGKTSVYYSVNFKKFLLYFIIFFEKVKSSPKMSVNIIKLELFDEHIIEKYWDAFEGKEVDPDPSIVSYISS